MRVIHTYPHNGQTVSLHEDSRFPNGPVSESDEDMAEFFQYNIEQMKEAAKTMKADGERRNLIVEIQKQTEMLSRIKGRINERIRLAKDQIKR